MPFTFSHPAIVMPIADRLKQNVSVTGLVIGSTVPDLEYFIRMKGLSIYSHSWAGLFWFDLPLGLLIAFFFHNFLRNPLIVQLPLFAQKRFQPHLRFNWNRRFLQSTLIVVGSFFFGSLSHLFWDRFVHTGARFLESFFEQYTAVSDDDDFLVYYLFFGLNSLAGLFFLRRRFWQLPTYRVTAQKQKGFAFWSVCSMTAIAFFLVRLLTSDDLPMLSFIDSAIASILLSLVLTVAVQKLMQARAIKLAANRIR